MPTARHTTIALSAVLIALALAGCSGRINNDAVGPVADLEASTDEPFVGEAVTFDGSDSDAPGDAKIVSWRFDFGDGTVFETQSDDEARVQHTYTDPGIYTVTLTVATEEDDGESERDTATEKIGVGERMPVSGALVNDPIGVDDASNMTLPVQVDEDATTFNVNLTVSGVSGFGSSRVMVAFFDPTGTKLDEREVTVDAGQDQHIELQGVLIRTGIHELRMEAESGAADVLGDVEIRYDPNVPN